MATIKSLTIKCIHCGAQSRSMIGFGDTQSLKGTEMSGNMQNCSACGKQTPVRKDLMTVTLEDGSTVNGLDL